MSSNWKILKAEYGDGMKKLRAEFETLIKDCTNDQFKAITYLGELDLCAEYKQKLILQPLRGMGVDAIQYALNNRGYKLFIALLHKVNAKEYFERHDRLLEVAIESYTDRGKRVTAVLRAYNIFSIPFDLHELPDRTVRLFYERSWGTEIIKLLYNSNDSFFIPRRQKKAKMHAFIYYNPCKNGGAKQGGKRDAARESKYITRGLKDAGFTVLSPLVNWTQAEILEDLEQHVKTISKKASVFTLCIMTHGDFGILLDKNSEPIDINEVLRIARSQLPPYIPFIMMLQSCHGTMVTDHSVAIRVTDGSRTDTTVDKRSVTALGNPRVSPIIARWLETIVVTATPSCNSATRDHFLSHMADQLRLSNGRTSFLTLCARCSNAMARVESPSFSAEAPLIESVLKKDLVLPKSLVYDKLTKVEKRGRLRKWAGIANEVFLIMKSSTP